MRSQSAEAIEIYFTGYPIQSPLVLDIDIIMWHVDPLLGNDSEISNYTTAVTT
jgi:hypothetical protein